MSRFPDVLLIQAEPDPVAAFWQAQHSGRLIGLRTSGTTQNPRVVVRTPASWADSFDPVSAYACISDSSRVYVPGPLTSTMNLFARVHASHVGADVVDTVDDATHVHLTPAAFELALDTIPSGVSVIVAGDSLRPSLRDRGLTRGLHVHHYYGSSEQSFVAWGTAADDLRAFPGVDVDIRDGVVWSRSAFSCEGYDEVTDSGVLVRDRHGWCSVGDRGSLVDGVLRVTGRGDDAITTAGATVLVADIEGALRPHAKGDVFVVGLAHQRLGAIVVAAVTDAGDAPLLADFARKNLPPAQRPRRWFALDHVPLTTAGKPDRAAVAALTASANPLPHS